MKVKKHTITAIIDPHKHATGNTQRGIVTHHHDQFITLHNFNFTTNVNVNVNYDINLDLTLAVSITASFAVCATIYLIGKWIVRRFNN